ncbi:MAG: hypothetical protein AB1Z98_23810 [Nannocystaceae bacterium]
MSILLSLFLATAGPSGQTASGDAASQSTPASVDQVRVVVDHRALLDEQIEVAAEDSAFYVLEDSVKALQEQHGVEVTKSEDAPAILIGLAWEDYDRTVYRIRVATQRPGEQPVEVVEFTARCIDSSALTKAVVDRLPAALEQLAKVQEPTSESGAQDLSAGEQRDAEVEPEALDEPRQHGARRVGAAGYAGIASLVAGLGVTAGGVAVLLQDPSERYAPRDDLAIEVSDRVPLGGALVGVGSGLLVAGAVLVALDQTVLRKRRAGKARVSNVAPVLWSAGAGLSWTTRF